MAEPAEMRASDADRERIASVLREAHADGRIPQDELLERLDSVYTATTYSQLDRLVTDIPRPRRPLEQSGHTVAAPVRRCAGRVPAQAQLSGFLRFNWWLWTSAVSINLVIWLLVSLGNGGLEYFWPMWVAGPWGAVLTVWTLAEDGRRRSR